MRSIKNRLLLKGRKNKKTIITILLALVSMNMYTQQRLTVRDSLTQEPIAYASVWFGNETGGYSDESGMIEIPEGTKQIRLSHICYETKNIAKVTADLQTIFLVPKSINLDEVAISAKIPKRVKTILASLDYSTHYLVFTEIKTPIYATLRFDLRLPNPKTGAPKDESLIDGGIILPSGQKLGKDGVSLPHPIPFPQTGVFVVVEWITTSQISESCNLVPSLNMTLDEKENRTWNKKTFFAKLSGRAERRGMDWMQEQDEPAYQNEEAQFFYKGRTPSAKLGLKISK